MIYRVVHITEYSYVESVATSHHLLHLSPRETERQTCRREDLEVSPEPASRVELIAAVGSER